MLQITLVLLTDSSSSSSFSPCFVSTALALPICSRSNSCVIRVIVQFPLLLCRSWGVALTSPLLAFCVIFPSIQMETNGRCFFLVPFFIFSIRVLIKFLFFLIFFPFFPFRFIILFAAGLYAPALSFSLIAGSLEIKSERRRLLNQYRNDSKLHQA